MLYAEIFKKLHENKIAYLIAGGIAVNLHQIERATFDLDLILHLNKKNILKFNLVMQQLGYQPKLPVKADDFADAKKRKFWIKEKNMLVFSFIKTNSPLELVDVFVKEPKPFMEMYKRKLELSAFGGKIYVLGIQDLIDLKIKAGREKDLFDLFQLQKLKDNENKVKKTKNSRKKKKSK